MSRTVVKSRDGGLVVVCVGGGGTDGGAVDAAKDSGDDEHTTTMTGATFKIHEYPHWFGELEIWTTVLELVLHKTLLPGANAH